MANKKTNILSGMSVTFVLIIIANFIFSQKVISNESQSQRQDTMSESKSSTERKFQTAIFAGGCFWCMESDFEKLDGVKSVVSGYTGGEKRTATYKKVSKNNTGHYEAVEVTYNPSLVSYEQLVFHFWRNIDPLDPIGQFCDKGDSYRSAIFYQDEEQLQTIKQSLELLERNPNFNNKIATVVTPATPFYKAEQYHQNYYLKNRLSYKYYRNGCRRDQRLKKIWGEEAGGIKH